MASTASGFTMAKVGVCSKLSSKLQKLATMLLFFGGWGGGGGTRDGEWLQNGYLSHMYLEHYCTLFATLCDNAICNSMTFLAVITHCLCTIECFYQKILVFFFVNFTGFEILFCFGDSFLNSMF